MEEKMNSKKPYFAALVCQITFAGMSLLSKAAFSSGTNTYIFFFYRQTVGTIFLLPLTIYFTRWLETATKVSILNQGFRKVISLTMIKKEMASLTKGDVLKIFMQAILGFTFGLNAYGLGVKYTSATLGAAAFNCIPVTTFFFALILRVEKVNVRKASGMAKVGGMMLCIAGVAVITFYKGPYLKPLFNLHLFQTQQSHVSSKKEWILGCFLLLLSCLAGGLWFVLQVWVLRSCPSPLVLTFGQTFSSVIQSFVVAIATERNPSQWKLAWNISLAAILYCGVFVVSLGNYLSSWVVKKKGPVFQAVSTPFNLIFTLIGSEFLLNDGISLGSAVGAILLVLSLYSVLWGKNKEASCHDTSNNTNSVPIEREMLDNI